MVVTAVVVRALASALLAVALPLALAQSAPTSAAAPYAGPIFDAHLHYNDEASERYSVADVLGRMIAHRPDWCISRQRNWGVPLPLFLHKVSGDLHPDTLALIDRAAEVVEQGGVEAWSRLTAEDVLGADGEGSAEHYAKSNDILDVWFDSGSTFFHVLRGSHPGTTNPDDDGKRPEADLYLEGHDQHRGWFHSSLLIACAVEGHGRARDRHRQEPGGRTRQHVTVHPRAPAPVDSDFVNARRTPASSRSPARCAG